jgi:hypothetical protein
MRIILSCLLLFTHFAQAQEGRYPYKKGLFMTYEDLSKNLPSDTSLFIVKAKRNFHYSSSIPVNLRMNQIGQPDSTSLMFEIFNDKGKKIKNGFAYSDGSRLFINPIIYRNNGGHYLRAFDVGRIIYFRDPVGYPSLALGGAYSYSRGIILYDSDKGEAFILDKKALQSILKENDSELYNLFMEESNQNNPIVLENYVVLFNQRNKK